MFIGQFIKEYRSKHGLSMQDFADLTGLSKAYIGMLEKIYNPKTNQPISPSLDKLNLIATGIGLPLDDLLKELDENQPVTVTTAHHKGVRIPVLGYIVAGVPIEAVEDILGYEEISSDLARTGNFFCLRIKGDSMEPTFTAGDVIVVKQQPDVESNEIAVVLVNGDEGTVKRIKKSDAGITLIGDNVSSFLPTFYSNEEIERLPVTIIGKVIELRRSF